MSAPDAPSASACVVCGAGNLVSLLDVPAAPVFCNQLCHTREEALAAPTARISLAFCPSCGHVFNAAFDPTRLEYSPEYENSLHFSGRFQEYADGLTSLLVQRYSLQGKTIVEIGCGRGDFLRGLCEAGANRGFGFDPSVPPEALRSEGRVRLSSEPYSERHADLHPDLVCCRHVLEHVAEPTAFLSQVRRSIGPSTSTRLFFEVPNVLYTLRDGGIWDIIYEHCHYFSPGSFGRAFEEAGFHVDEVAEAFSGQFLNLHARGNGSEEAASGDGASSRGLADDFAEGYRAKISRWTERLGTAAADNKRVVVWGAGSKGNSFLNLVGREEVDAVVDINPRKHGKFVAGTGQEIVAPERLVERPPDLVVGMNSVYAAEIAAQLLGLGIKAELIFA